MNKVPNYSSLNRFVVSFFIVRLALFITCYKTLDSILEMSYTCHFCQLNRILIVLAVITILFFYIHAQNVMGPLLLKCHHYLKSQRHWAESNWTGEASTYNN